jgi:EAL domain-containing protein (putative c-di-GMP-specific phosphodiesterase class I)
LRRPLSLPGLNAGVSRAGLDDGQVLLAPDIVPVAEKLGLIRLVDHRVLELVVAELAGSPNVQLSLNISPDTTMDPNWWALIESLMRLNPGVAERLMVEITETVAIRDVDDLRGFVTRLKNFGSRIAIDDFGAGHTAFRNLRKLGVDIVKIDGAFVQNVARSADDRAFVQTLIDPARRLQIRTVAEWVQDEEAAVMLRDWGCDYIQRRLPGYLSVVPAKAGTTRASTTALFSALSTCDRGAPACPSSDGEGRRYCPLRAQARGFFPARRRQRFRCAEVRTA